MRVEALPGQAGDVLIGLSGSSNFAVDDMQIAEGLQLVVGHMRMQWVKAELRQRAGESS